VRRNNSSLSQSGSSAHLDNRVILKEQAVSRAPPARSRSGGLRYPTLVRALGAAGGARCREPSGAHEPPNAKALDAFLEREAESGSRSWIKKREVGRSQVAAARSPWQNAFVERLILSVSPRAAHQVIALDENQLRRLLGLHVSYFTGHLNTWARARTCRTHDPREPMTWRPVSSLQKSADSPSIWARYAKARRSRARYVLRSRVHSESRGLRRARRR
jgi:hypothetical protein